MEAREPVLETQGILGIWRSLRGRERLGLSLTFPVTCLGELEVVSNRGRGDENGLCAPHVGGQRPTAASLGEPSLWKVPTEQLATIWDRCEDLSILLVLAGRGHRQPVLPRKACGPHVKGET